jgi:hypothetical protein
MGGQWQRTCEIIHIFLWKGKRELRIRTRFFVHVLTNINTYIHTYIIDEEMKRVFDKFLKYHTKTLLGDFNT